MAFRAAAVAALAEAIKAVRVDWTPREALSLSWVDIILSKEKLFELLGIADVEFRWDSDEILRWHKTTEVNDVPDWHGVLRRLGFAPMSVDVVQARGVEAIQDMDELLTFSHEGRYALVIDHVLGHCFNPSQCLKNIWRSLAIGGVALHVVALVQQNHGYYSPSPVLFKEFYEANGCELLFHRGYTGVRAGKFDPIEITYNRTYDVNVDSVQIVAARKTTATAFVMPMQSKFAAFPHCKVPVGAGGASYSARP